MSQKMGKKKMEKKKEGAVKMKREVGPVAAVMIILGAIIGSGIYVSPKGTYL